VHGDGVPFLLPKRGIVGKERGRVAVGPDSEQREVESDPAELGVVQLGGLVRSQLSADSVLRGRMMLEPLEQALPDKPVVRALVVGLDAPLVGEPELRAAPVGLQRRGELVGRPWRRAAGEGDVPAPRSRFGKQLRGASTRGIGARRDPQLEIRAGQGSPAASSRPRSIAA
jgi:hypothetical protein